MQYNRSVEVATATHNKFEEVDKVEYNEKLKELRVQSGMSQDDLADKLHVARQTVSKWEQGVNEPDIYTLKQYAEIFKVSLDELLGDVEKVNKSANKRRKASKILFLISTLLYVFSVIFVFVLWRFLQDSIPVHFNAAWEIDRYGNKAEVLLHLLAFSVYYAMALIVYAIGKKNLGTKLPNPENKAFIVIFSIILTVQIGYLAFVVGITAKSLITEKLMQFIYCVTGDLLFVVGLATHPKITPQNTIMGMRTNFTLTNPEAWNKTNALAAICLPVAAAIMIAINMIFTQLWVTLASPAIILVGAGVVYIYHEVLRKKMSK